MKLEDLDIIKKIKNKVNETNYCWLWSGSVTSAGYGDIQINYKRYSTHRYFYMKAFGDIPEGLHVLHKCDVRNCVNPDHLFLGTNLDNIKDAMKKGRKGGKKNKLKNYCIRGHEFKEGSFKLIKSNGKRLCLSCEKTRNLIKKKRRQLKWSQVDQPSINLNTANH